MKKIFFVIALAFVVSSVFAISNDRISTSNDEEFERPFKVGGSLGLSWIEDVGVDFTLSPEFTYDINRHWGIGASIDVRVVFDREGTELPIVASPFVRYTPWRVGIFSLFLDLGGSIGGSSNLFLASVGVSPGLAFDFTKHFTFIMNLGFIGYQYNMNPKVNLLGAGGPNSVGIDLSSSNLTIGGFFRI